MSAHINDQVRIPVHLLRQRHPDRHDANHGDGSSLYRLSTPAFYRRQKTNPFRRENGKSDGRQIDIAVAYKVAIPEIAKIERRRQADQQPTTRKSDDPVARLAGPNVDQPGYGRE